MLVNLSVENYALIDSLEVDFDSRLNIITGETGAGKSILLGALSLLLGARNEGAAIKDSSRNCVVEAQFDIKGLCLEQLFEQEDIDYEDVITIRRIITPSGKSRAYIGDQPVQLTTLKAIADRIIDIHSQHRNLILSSEQFREEALDTIANCTALRREFNSAYAALNAAKSALAEAEKEISASRKEEEWLRHQVAELKAAHLKEDEERELETELAALSNTEAITEAYGSLHLALTDEQTGILPQIAERLKALKSLSEYYPDAKQASERLASVLIELQDLDMTAETTLEKTDADPERLDTINARLQTLYNLKLKHHAQSITELIAIFNRYSEQLSGIDNADSRILQLKEEVESKYNTALSIAQSIAKAHAVAAKDFEHSVDAILSKVGMPDAKFKVGITDIPLCSTGIETIDFLFTANSGIAPRQIDKIASGGELSRVMLALKAILARQLMLPTIIFDEIDTGVSGRVANAVGEVIATLAENMQIINITHLPQVASKGNKHFLVYKDNSVTNMRLLEHNERTVEIAKMLSGDIVTDAALKQAQILLGQ